MKAHLQDGTPGANGPASNTPKPMSARDRVSSPGALAAAIGTLADHDALLERFAAMHLERVRHLRPIAGEDRADTPARARRRVDELPVAIDLEGWYRTLRQALDTPVDDKRSRILVATLLHALRGKPAEAIVVDAFVLALAGSRMSPRLVAGAVKRAIATCSVRPSAAAFLRIAEAHRAEVRAALDDVVRTMGLRKDAAKVVGGVGECR